MNNHKQSAGCAATRARAAIFLSGCLLLGLAPTGFTQTIWQAESGDWFQPVNWSDGVPNSTADAQINNGGTAQILNGAATANDLSLGGGASDSNSGTLIVSGSGSSLDASSIGLSNFGVGTLMILDGATVSSQMSSILGATHLGGEPGSATVDGAGSTWETTFGLEVDGELNIQNGGAVTSDSGTTNGAVVIDGTGSNWVTGEIFVATGGNGSLSLQNGGVLTSSGFAYVGGYPGGVGSATVDGPGSSWNNDFDNVSLTVGFGADGTLSISNGGLVSTFAAEIAAAGDSENGSVTVSGPNSALNVRTNLNVGGSDPTVSPTPGPQPPEPGPQPGGIGSLQISDGASVSCQTARIFGHGSLIDDSSLTCSATLILPGGSLSGNGSVSGDVSSAGQIAPGDSLGKLAIVGNFTQDAAGKLVFEINGASPDAQGTNDVIIIAGDHLSITGSATLDGTVEVRFTEGFLPVQGQVFELIDVSGSVSLSFAHVIFPDLRSGFQFNTQFVNGRYQITALSDGAPAAGILNISTRGQVGVDDDGLIAGFIVTGTTDKQVVIRGLGPSLAAGGISLSDLLADPTLELRDQTGALITFNDNWMDSPQRQAIIDSMLVPSDDRESAILATLAPGSYTAILRGAGEGTGLGIVEVYNLGPDLSSNLANISTRGLVNTGDQVLIGGFIVDDQNSIVLLRGLGPSLTSAGVADALANPTLELHNGDGDVIAFNNDWQSTDEAIIQNTGLAPQFSEESAILVALGPGAFTAILRGFDDSSGVGLFEVYNLR
jgi:T5SS/PEP-CTERM-associated repeat protein